MRRAASVQAADGFALVPILLLLMLLAGLSASAGQLALLGDRTLRSDHQQHMAQLAAQAAIDDAVQDIQASTDPLRRAAFDGGPKQVDAQWPETGCGEGALQGLCAYTEQMPWTDPGWVQQTITFGSQTERSYPVGGANLPFQAPRYRIERLAPEPDAPAGYRITAIGYGSMPGHPGAAMYFHYQLAANASAPASSATPSP